MQKRWFHHIPESWNSMKKYILDPCAIGFVIIYPSTELVFGLTNQKKLSNCSPIIELPWTPNMYNTCCYQNTLNYPPISVSEADFYHGTGYVVHKWVTSEYAI